MSYYDQKADELFAQYTSLDPEIVHSAWKHLVQETPGLACDIGAGSGRDANWLAEQGWDVIAVEPSEKFRELAAPHAHPRVSWVDGELPRLKALREAGYRFDLILVSAVWMHLSSNQRAIAFRVLGELLAAGGLLVISVRREDDPEVRDARGFYEVDTGELRQFAVQRALELVQTSSEPDRLGRDGVGWETLCFRLPDDGTGSLPLLRHVIVNDNKSASYKLGLVRTLLRIADGAPGLVLRSDEDWVDIPFGAVGLYWLKLYLPLIKSKLPQHPNRNRGFGFAREDFYALQSRSRFDLRIGARLAGEDARIAIGAINQACKNIKEMPAHYLTYPGSSDQVFECDRKTVKRAAAGIELNKHFLASFGTFRVPLFLWQTLSQYGCWLEPALVNEWVSLMKGWDQSLSNSDRAVGTYLNALEWREDKRDTDAARGQFLRLRTSDEAIRCTWSDRSLTEKNFVIDHCFPWSRWYNNDLWNLMPATGMVNGKKGDKLPSAQLMMDARPRIMHWWESAYTNDNLGHRFYSEAEAALPFLASSTSPTLETIFAAVMLQRKRLRANQGLAEWSL